MSRMLGALAAKHVLAASAPPYRAVRPGGLLLGSRLRLPSVSLLASLILSSLPGMANTQRWVPCTSSSPASCDAPAEGPAPPLFLSATAEAEPPLPDARGDDARAAGTEGGLRHKGGARFRLNESCFLVLHQGDITKWSVDGKMDAIVNAANERMLGGGGVDGAIHKAAGRKLYEECLRLPLKGTDIRCPTGEAVITNAYNLPVSRIIHTVGPIYEDKSSAIWLEKAYLNSVMLAVKNGIRHLAFPAISCGVYGYPYGEAAEVALRTLKENANDLEIHFVLFEKGSWEAWLSAASRLEKI